ncbi:MAG: Fic family protein [Verrucomicrobiota bacterium]|nr:Fic family protein [Verrucomicrobiota bacterium]
MPWNWELSDWPNWTYDPALIAEREKKFLLSAGENHAYLKLVEQEARNEWMVDICCTEGVESWRIEGELLDRTSLQKSIRREFGLESDEKEREKEKRAAFLLYDVYKKYAEPVTDAMLFSWHCKMFEGKSRIENIGTWRTHPEPMQIVSNRLGNARIYFEAPPSHRIPFEIQRYLDWLNGPSLTLPILVRASLSHLYFEAIHPFEDGNGRIGRLLVEKVISQSIGHPILIALSQGLEKRKKEYYKALGSTNCNLQADAWIEFFSKSILQAQEEALQLLLFLMAKTQFFSRLAGELSARQEKALRKMFAAGVEGFKGDLSAEKYIAITKTSRATATRDLNDLVEKGALVKRGELRHARYTLKINQLTH